MVNLSIFKLVELNYYEKLGCDTVNIDNSVALRILELCRNNDITVNKLSNICGITQSTLNNIINGNSKNPTVSTVKKICDGLGISLSEFFYSNIFDNLEQEVK
jgi:transcriptional regulator with XRE-family HTH domain